LRSYFKQGLNTIRKIVSTYAPSNENDTDNYIYVIADKTGFDPDEVLTYDEDTAKALINAIAYMENGTAPNPKDVNEGFKLYQA